VKRANRARTKNKTVLAFWLVPARPERDLFAELIRILAVELKAPRFEPHLTICSGPDTKTMRGALKTITAYAVRLRVRGLAAGEEYTKSLFIRFRATSTLDDLNRQLRRAAKLPTRAIPDPHVSLLYMNMPLSSGKELARTIHLPFREVTFDSIKLVRCNSSTKTANDINSWRVIATKKLSG
jgi:hypothetical protein